MYIFFFNSFNAAPKIEEMDINPLRSRDESQPSHRTMVRMIGPNWTKNYFFLTFDILSLYEDSIFRKQKYCL